MKNCICFLILSIISCLSASAQIKNLFKDSEDKNRTIVIKENGANDYQILDEKFGDAKVGEVIRITTNKAPKTKAVPEQTNRVIKKVVEKPKREEPKKTSPKSIAKPKPKPPIEKPKVVKQRPAPIFPTGVPGTYPIKDHPKGKKVFVKKKKKLKQRKKIICFSKW